MATSGGSWVRWIIAFIFWMSVLLVISTGLEVLKASQCFKSRGIPKVSFNCPSGEMVKIHKAFHGITVNDRSTLNVEEQCSLEEGQDNTNCSLCDGDCVDDSMNLVYDWSTCMGNSTCTRTVMQSFMPNCKGPDKFSDYLQVEYQCIPREDVMDICSTMERKMTEGYIMSPNYPNNYPTNQECLCRIYTDWSSKIILSLYDLLLETKNGRCRADWLMLRQEDQKHRHCGAIMTGVKNITSETNALAIQFHSDENDNRTQNFQYFTRSLKGFWLYVTAEPKASVTVACRRLTDQDAEVKEIKRDDDEYDAIMSTKHVESTPIPDLDNQENNVVRDDKDAAADNDPNSTKGKPRNRIRQNGNGKAASGKEATFQDGRGQNGNNSGNQINGHFVLMVTMPLVLLINL